MSKWNEIRNEYTENGIIYIDAWLTPDDNSQGTVIATVNKSTKEVIYFNEDAKTDVYAQAMINEALDMPVVKNIGETILTVGELKAFLSTLNDNDQVVIETIDKNGDVEDLYPFHMDVIDGIELTDGSKVSEVRFCQEKNTTEERKPKVYKATLTPQADPENPHELSGKMVMDLVNVDDPYDRMMCAEGEFTEGELVTNDMCYTEWKITHVGNETSSAPYAFKLPVH